MNIITATPQQSDEMLALISALAEASDLSECDITS